MGVESDASSQVMSMTIEGVKMTAEVAGKGLEKVGAITLAFISLISKKIKENKALSVGEKKLDLMRKSGNALQDFVIPKSMLNEFKNIAKDFRLTYSTISSRKSDDIIIVGYQAEASRLGRIIEELKINIIEPETPIEQAPEVPDVEIVSTEAPFSEEQVSDLYEILNPNEPDESSKDDNADPFATNMDKSSPSGPYSQNIDKESSNSYEHSEKSYSSNVNSFDDKPSVRERLNNIGAKQKQNAEKAKETIKDSIEKFSKVADTISR